tara:strand:- start:948 stop:1355 length:408 start_codon:yes stop_codon:yes gene_type:complete
LNEKISKKDLQDWENFLSNKEKLPNKDLNLSTKKKKEQMTIDLHGYSLNEANEIVEEMINKSHKMGINKLKIVTGKGLHSKNEKDPYISKDLGILKYSIPEFIKNDKNLMNLIKEIKEAKIEDGGSGAFYVYLKK